MKTTRHISTLISCSLVAAAVLGGCSEEGAKVDLPEGAASASPAPEASASAEGDPKSSDSDDSGADAASTQSTSNDSNAPATVGAQTRRLSGSFEPQRTTGAAANVGGIIRKVYVDEGDVVEQGDRLIDIDSQDYRLNVAQAKAAVDAAQAQVDTLETEYNRTERLLERDAVAQSQADQLSGNLAGARAKLQQAKVGLRLARKKLSDAIIRAPYDGVITSVNVAEGDFAAPGPSALVKLEEIQHLYLRVHVPEEFATQIAKGDQLEAHVPAIKKTIRLPVTRINPTISGQSRSFDVLAELDNPTLEVQPGMFAEVTRTDTPMTDSTPPEGEASAVAQPSSKGGDQ